MDTKRIAERVANSVIEGGSRVGKSADTEYQYKFRGVEKRLSDVGKLLKKHKDNQAKSNTDWGHVGDLGHIDDMLVDIIRFMS